MKRLFIALISILILCSCSSKQDDLFSTPESSDDEINIKSQAHIQVTYDQIICYTLETDNELLQSIKNRFEVEPYYLTFTPDYSQIGWSASIDGSNSNENCELKKYTLDNQLFASLYFGELTQLSENVYSVKGNLLSSQKNNQISISDSIDYYLVFQEEKLFFVFEEMELSKLQQYESNSYFIKQEKINSNTSSNTINETINTPLTTVTPEETTGTSSTPHVSATPNPIPSSTPEETPKPHKTSEPTISIDSDFSEAEKKTIRNEYTNYLKRYNSDLVSAEYGENSLHIPSLDGYGGEASEYFLVYVSSRPGISIRMSYTGANYLINAIGTENENQAFQGSHILDINRLIYGTEVYDIIYRQAESLLLNTEFKFSLIISNPWTNEVYSESNDYYWENLSPYHPLHVQIYVLLDEESDSTGKPDLDQFNDELINYVTEFFKDVPISLTVESSFTSKYDSYGDYFLQDAFWERQSDFYSQIHKKAFNSN